MHPSLLPRSSIAERISAEMLQARNHNFLILSRHFIRMVAPLSSICWLKRMSSCICKKNVVTSNLRNEATIKLIKTLKSANKREKQIKTIFLFQQPFLCFFAILAATTKRAFVKGRTHQNSNFLKPALQIYFSLKIRFIEEMRAPRDKKEVPQTLFHYSLYPQKSN